MRRDQPSQLPTFLPAPDAPFYPPTPQAPTPAPVASADRTARPLRKWPAILSLCLLAAIIPETIASNSTPVIKIIAQPLSLPLNILFYGAAALLTREAMIRRRLGLGSLILFGVAFGFINEGAVNGAWFTALPDGYVFYVGIDWGWVVGLTIFHVLISVITPLTLIETLFPRIVGQPLLRRRGIVVSAMLFAALTLSFTLLGRPHVARLVILALALGLAVVAYMLPPQGPFVPSVRAIPGPWRLRILSALAALILLFLFLLAPRILMGVFRPWRYGALATQIIVCALLIYFTAMIITLGVVWSRRMGWSARHRLAIITGALFVPVMLSLGFGWAIWEPLLSVPFFGLLIWLSWRVRRAR